MGQFRLVAGQQTHGKRDDRDPPGQQESARRIVGASLVLARNDSLRRDAGTRKLLATVVMA